MCFLNRGLSVTMRPLKLMKATLITLSIFMFLFQSKTATEKLQEQPIGEKSEHENFNKIDKPLLTICPKDQYDRDLVFER